MNSNNCLAQILQQLYNCIAQFFGTIVATIVCNCLAQLLIPTHFAQCICPMHLCSMHFYQCIWINAFALKRMLSPIRPHMLPGMLPRTLSQREGKVPAIALMHRFLIQHWTYHHSLKHLAGRVSLLTEIEDRMAANGLARMLPL